MNRYYVYILRCNGGSYYVGVTNDVEQRVLEHQEGADGPKSYTFRRRPVVLVYQHVFREVLDAIAAEKQIKGWSRKKKEALIMGKVELLTELSKSGYAKRIDTIASHVLKECNGLLDR